MTRFTKQMIIDELKAENEQLKNGWTNEEHDKEVGRQIADLTKENDELKKENEFIKNGEEDFKNATEEHMNLLEDEDYLEEQGWVREEDVNEKVNELKRNIELLKKDRINNVV